VDRAERIDKLIGRAVVSLETANQMGTITDLLIDPLSGELAGLAVKRKADTSDTLVSMLDVHGMGPDAIIVKGDESLVLADASPLATLPRAMADLVNVKVLSEHGHLLGSIANLFLCFDKRPVFIYEVRSSLIDKLLGRAFYFAASLGCAFSDDQSALVVTAEPAEMDHRVEAAVERLLGVFTPVSQAPMFTVQVRTHAE